ncbi:hypothetical protein DYB38_014399 [Aphanomyces astaci]|uniref:SCP domain-containing protein n=1 Tax=Aphanomyces astaci TaxID=112090 RepID=A0A397EBM2_APHAT|nr:hypothetical protein DYB34_014070 [Aphanomyces astaci]RHY77328.1 hypothetical protein DYB38_014399 [Aphanomyces astaci]RHZ12059.1 hypothetical protein DYB31_002888 [Aphanomyces astaci]
MKKDPARVDRLFAAARLAIRDEQVAASAAKDDAPPSDEHGGKTLSEEEFAAAVAAELNAVRTNPQSYIPYLEAMLTQFSGNILTIPSEGIRLQTEEGPTAVQDCLVFLKAHPPVDYLVLEPNMSKAAVDHALDLGNNGAVSHTGKLLAFGLCRPRNVVLQLLVDDGVPTRGDRMTLMDNKFKSVGVGFHTHKFQKFVCVLDFAGGFGALVDKLTTAKLVHARGEITADVELVLQSIPFDELKIEVREVLTNAPQKSVSLNYKPGSVTVTNPDGSSQIKSGTWGVADAAQ